jgi:hypothetical protein
MWTPGHVAVRVVKVTWVDLELLALSPFGKPMLNSMEAGLSFLGGNRRIRSLKRIAVTSAKVAIVDSGEVCRSAVWKR